MKKPYPQKASIGEETFLLHCRAYKLEPVREHRFCERGWRFDFAWPDKKIAVEVEGGTQWGKSRHSFGAGFERDVCKYNRAAVLGWIVLRFSTRMVTSGEAINELLEVLHGNG
jgi:very-short-patch-repair endonuclease